MQKEQGKMISMKLDNRTNYYLDELMNIYGLNRTRMVSVCVNKLARYEKIVYEVEDESFEIKVREEIDNSLKTYRKQLLSEEFAIIEERADDMENEKFKRKFTDIQSGLRIITHLITMNEQEIKKETEGHEQKKYEIQTEGEEDEQGKEEAIS